MTSSWDIDSTKGHAPFLLLAHHRSGSNFLHDLLQSHPGIECVNEPLSMHTRFFRQCDLVPWSAAEFHPQHLHVALARHKALRAYLEEFRRYLFSGNGARVLGFKETALFGKLDWLKEFMPSLKLVWLVRDPRAIVSSVLRSGLTAFWCYDDLVPKAFRDQWPRYRSCSVDEDPAMRLAEVAAMSVAVRYALARRSLSQFDHFAVSLDHMLADPFSVLASLNEFLGLEPHPDQDAFLARRHAENRGGMFSSYRAPDVVRTGWRQHLGPQEMAAIDHVMAEAGFEEEALALS